MYNGNIVMDHVQKDLAMWSDEESPQWKCIQDQEIEDGLVETQRKINYENALNLPRGSYETFMEYLKES